MSWSSVLQNVAPPGLVGGIAVCVAEAVPVASGAWHGLVSVKALAR